MKANAAAFAELQTTKTIDELSNEIAFLQGDDEDIIFITTRKD